MAKRFMYVCLGILALVGAFHLGARYGGAQSYVDHSSGGIVAFHPSSVLLESGEVWDCSGILSGWTRQADRDPPVPVSEIKFWERDTFVTMSNEMWHREGTEWVNYGSPPGVVANQSTTWGEIKAKLGE
jgi:hypothetical protein